MDTAEHRTPWVPKVTVDTCVIIDACDDTRKEARTVFDLARHGKIDLATSSRAIDDIKRDEDEARRNRHLTCASACRVLQAPGGPPGSGRLKAESATESELEHKLVDVIFGRIEGARSEQAHNKYCDVNGLLAHVEHKRDVFLTSDNDFLRNREELQRLTNTKIERPEEFLSELKSLGIH